MDCLTRAVNEGATITDEASALEYCGFHPQLVAGRADNIKVTRPEDLAPAELYLTRSRHQVKAYSELDMVLTYPLLAVTAQSSLAGDAFLW